MISVETMPDVTGGSDRAALGLNTFRIVGGYVTGANDPGIEWTEAEWEAIKPAVGLRIYQGFGPVPDLWSFDELDTERGALSAQQCADIVKSRVDAGIQWTYLYGSLSYLIAAAAAIQKLGDKYWIGHVQCRLADWNLSRLDAEGYVGQFVAGMGCYAVQWASPESNPNTIMPGPSGLTLKEANVDLSVIRVDWEPTPAKGTQVTAPPPSPAPAATLTKILAEFSDGSSKVLLTV